MKSKITEKFEELQANKQKALIGYITSGDPDLETTVKLVTILEESGVDIIELGIPYSDPLADGPVIQRASLRALNKGANINSIFNMVTKIRERTNIPIAFLVYFNSIFRYGINNFLINCRSCGIDGLIIPDLPLEERKELNEQMKGYAIDLIPLVAPTSDDRIKKIVKDAQGFVYCISSKGVTGMRASFEVDLATFMKKVRKHTNIPLAIGFGISDEKMVRELKNLADGLIVGSAIIKKIEEGIIEDDIDKMAFSRGPLVYCAEWIDNEGRARNILIDKNLEFEVTNQPYLLHGIHTLHSKAYSVSLDSDDKLIKKSQKLNLIPYYSWAHRGNGEMVVWFPYTEKAAHPTLPPTIASESKVTASYVYDQISALNDQINPKSSNDPEIPRFTFWSHKGTKEWVQYDLKKPTSIAYIHLYWFDDGPQGGCRLPKSWKAFYLLDGKWKEVYKNGEYPIFKDGLNTIEIAPVKAEAIRLEIELQDDYSGGILEWKIE